MGLPAQPMHVPAGLAFDESIRQELLDVGQANVANKNVRSTFGDTLVKRLGFAAQSLSRTDATTRSAGRRVFAHGANAAPCVNDGTTIDVYLDALTKSVSHGTVPDASWTRFDAPSVSRSAEVADIACTNGYVAIAEKIIGAATFNYYITLLDSTTFAVVRGPELVAAPVDNAGFGLAVYGSSSEKIAAVSSVPSINSIVFYVLDTTSAATIALGWVAVPAMTIAGLTSTGELAVADGGSVGTVFTIAFDHTAGANRVGVRTMNSSGVVHSANVGGGTTPNINTIDLSEGSNTIWVCWAESANVKICGLDPANIANTPLASTLTAFTPSDRVSFACVCSRAPGKAAVAARTDTDELGTYLRAVKTTAGAAATDGSLQTVNNAYVMGRPFLRGTKMYAWWAPRAADSLTLCEWSPLTSVGASPIYLRPVVHPISRGLVTAASGPLHPRCRTALLSFYAYVFSFSAKRTGISDGVSSGKIDFADIERWETAPHHGCTMLSGGVTSLFDGTSLVEAGFLCAPMISSINVASAGSQTFSAGGRRYVAVYAWPDASGNLHLSGVSAPSAATGNITSKKVLVLIEPLSITSRTSGVEILLYATTDGGDVPYYLVGSGISDSRGLVTIEDNLASVISGAKLYAPSLPGSLNEALDRRAPPGLRHILSYAGMLVGSDGESIRYSGQEVYGEGTWWSPDFEIPISGGGGDITALAAIDGMLVVFKRDRIYVIIGDSPSDNGASGGFGEPRLIASEVGCISANSVVVTSLGVFFQSSRGIELFSRAQTVEWIGRAVMGTLEDFPVITSAVVDERNDLLRFTLTSSVGADGLVVPYNSEDPTGSPGGRHVTFCLSTRTWTSVDDHPNHEPAQHASYVQTGGTRRYVWLGSDGTLHTEKSEDDAHAYRDGTSTWITASYTLPPWKTGLQQEQRIYEMELLFERYTAAGLTIEVAENYGTFAVTKTWTSAALNSQRRAPFRPSSHGSATQLRVTDADGGADDSGRGYEWIGISADIAAKQGATRGTTRTDPSLRR